MKFRLILVVAVGPIVLAGCGGDTAGGTAGGSTASLTSYLSMYEPVAISSSNIQATGSASSNTNTASASNFGQATTTLSAVSFSGYGNSPATSVTYQMFSNKHLIDTDAQNAWAAGWTGLGKSISVIDDFSSISVNIKTTLNATRDWVSPGFGSTHQYAMNYEVNQALTHGEIVSNIAGGDGNVIQSSRNIDYTVSGANSLGCSVMGSTTFGTTPYCADLSTRQYVVPGIYSLKDLGNNTSVINSAGVAKEATMVNNHVDLSASQNTTNTLNGIISHYQNSSDMAAINLSLGLSINTVGMTYDQLKSELNTFGRISTTDSVVTIAAGNGGAACTTSNLNGCNALAVVFAIDPNTNKNTILVGATSGSGSSEAIASYSSRAGMFANRYLMASGDTGIFLQSDSSEVKGTSFSAPRVAGAAAILRHKFPSLSGADAASILLLTASKDINSDGTNDFSGISATYGHGKLNIASALSPVGTLAIQ